MYVERMTFQASDMSSPSKRNVVSVNTYTDFVLVL